MRVLQMVMPVILPLCPTPPTSPDIRRKRLRARSRVPCLNQPHGCRLTFPSLEDAEEHLDRCHRRKVNCESCGKRVAIKELQNHQKASRCLEGQLRQEVVRSARKIKDDVISHALSLKMERVRLGRYENRRYRDAVHERIGWCPRVPSARSQPPRSAGVSIMRSISSAMTVDTSNPTPTPSVYSTGLPDSARLTDRRSFSRHTASVNGYLGPCPTVLDHAPVQCQRCHKSTWPHANHGTACRWHKGPILELFGGMCQHCGRLDHQPGCERSAHLLL